MRFDFDVWWGTIYVWLGDAGVLKGCGRVTTRAFARDTGFLTCNDMPKRERRSAAQARAEAVYRLANPKQKDDRGDRGRDRRAEKVEYRHRLKNARAEAAALAVPDAAPEALVPSRFRLPSLGHGPSVSTAGATCSSRGSQAWHFRRPSPLFHLQLLLASSLRSRLWRRPRAGTAASPCATSPLAAARVASARAAKAPYGLAATTVVVSR